MLPTVHRRGFFDNVSVRRPVDLRQLILGLYWYGMIQVVAIVVAFFTLVSRSDVRWEKTPKRPQAGVKP